jgi:hypothetical protein
MLNKAKSPEKFVSPLRNFVNDEKNLLILKNKSLLWDLEDEY